MGCELENIKRKTYENTKKLAILSKQITGFTYTIYKIKENVCEFCRKEEYKEERGTKITDV